MENVENNKKLISFSDVISNYISRVEDEFRHLWNSWEIVLSEKEKHEVISSLIARQITITIHFVSSPVNWTGDIAPIILRSLADNYINIAWILKSPLDRSRKFIYYGLGREKLNVEHRKNQMEEDGYNSENDPIILASKEWINFHQYDFLTDVSLSSWSEKSVYQMAEEADCKDFYNHVYQPFSSAAHNTWNHVGRYNVGMSENPLHNRLLIPRINHPDPHHDYLELAAKYVEKVLNLFHDTFDIERKGINAYKLLREDIFRLIDDGNEEE